MEDFFRILQTPVFADVNVLFNIGALQTRAQNIKVDEKLLFPIGNRLKWNPTRK
jgi:hypothetical protein